MKLMTDASEAFKDRIKEIFTDWAWAPGNYFYYGYATGSFTPDCCPRYMSEEYYPKLLDRAHKVELFHGTLAEAAKTRNDWTVISVLDSMDWMPPQMVADVVRDLTKRKGSSSGDASLRPCTPQPWRSFSLN